MIKHTYFICNQEKEPERYHSILKQINEINMTDYTFSCFIWGNDITPEIREQWCKSDTTMKYHGRDMISCPLTNGEISLFLNHIYCLKEIRKIYNEGCFCIFESDVLFKPSYNINLQKVLEISKEYTDIDIINIGTGCGGKYSIPKSKPVCNYLTLYKEKKNKCIEGIIWTYHGICKFLDYFEKENDIDGPIDTKIDVLSEFIGGFNIYWANPPLVNQGSITGLFKQTKV
jgi:GR25 family glycosyltransferase involved in LPS biosynthesis